MNHSTIEQKPGNSHEPTPGQNPGNSHESTPGQIPGNSGESAVRGGTGSQDGLACPRKTTIGGQALIEGLLMIGPERKAMAIRRLDGSIYIEQLPMGKFSKAAEIPFIRGSVRLFRQLVTGTSALMRSAELSEEGPAETVEASPAAGPAAADASPGSNAASVASEASTAPAPSAGPALSVDETGLPVLAMSGAPASASAAMSAEPASASAAANDRTAPRKGAIDRFLERHMNLMLYGSVVLGILFSVGLFILLPNFITGLINQFTPLGSMTGWSTQVLRSLIEGLFRITLFIGYLFLASRMKDIQRVWQYHGAEHKTIACYESGQALTVENTRPFSRFHPRCGTAFMFIVIIVSIIVFAFLGWHSRWINLLIRFALVPLVAGISYEIIRLAGRHDNRFTRAISVPGLLLQRLTTAEPDDSMLEVAIAAMDAVRPRQEGVQDKW